MDIQMAIIEVLFSKTPVEVVLKQITASWLGNNQAFMSSLHSIIVQHLEENIQGYSEDERENVYEWMMEKNHSFDIFSILLEFSQKVLVEYDYKPYCHFEHLLRWRQISHKIDPDIIITAFLAKRDLESGRARTNFTWAQVIRTDNVRLHHLLNEGMAENHFHLKGSAPYYQLSWMSLMNRIVGRSNEFKSTGIANNKLNKSTWYIEGIQQQSLRCLVIKAAIIRLLLFERLMHQDADESPWMTILNTATEEELEIYLVELQKEISMLKWIYGKEFYKNRAYVVDYAITKKAFTVDNNNYKKLLFGERKFMYECFRVIFDNQNELGKTNFMGLFYTYLLIKYKFRAEMIQINDRVGFKNFSDYQDRKTKFLKDEPILKEAINYMAVLATQQDQNIIKLEARISPEENTHKTRKEIQSIDRVIHYQQEVIDDEIAHVLYERVQDFKLSHFYVIHAIKGKDKRNERLIKDDHIRNDNRLLLTFRDFDKRRQAKNMAYQLMTMREERMDVASRIYGIDAASSEIGCRPEVYAQVFRMLKKHTVSREYDPMQYLILSTKKSNVSLKEKQEIMNIPPLKITYHVGEDFLDVADGLRAIDEAITYMNLSHGERIGHALALGIDVQEWYRLKNRHIILPKQDYLDDVCWLLNKIELLHIPVDMNSKMQLEREFQTYYEDIYEVSKDNKFHVNYRDYYNAWLLRGDNPELYASNSYNPPHQFCLWDRCGINEKIQDGEQIRKNQIAFMLYHRYHYDFDVRQRGSKMLEYKVNDYYIEIVSKVQLAMQQKVRDKGIAIETNPSSNYMIGTFKRYDKHPIISFFNLGLTYDEQQLKKCPQLFVSINTDDQAVFGTYLENEYALLALALQKAKDSEGQPLYNIEMIYDWLNRIRLMGVQQSFENISK